MPTRKPAIRVVEEGERAVKAAPTTVLGAAQASERDLLVMMRDKLAAEWDAGRVPAHALDKVARQIREFDKAVRGLDVIAQEEGSSDAGDPGDAWDETAI